MKINPAPIYFFENSGEESLKEGLSSSFEQLLNPSEKQNSGDEYYWSHQQELECSELRFNSVAGKENLEVIQLTKVEPELKHLSNFEVTEKAEASLDYNLKELSTKAYFSKNKIVINPIESKVKLKKNRLTICDSLKPDQPIKNSVLKLIKLLEKRIFIRPFDFKLQHLFINGSEAEFSFNTANLSPQQTNELSHLVKSWLSAKGIKLQQLIINGVNHD